MIKKTYYKPTVNEEKIQYSQMLCGSLSSLRVVQASGLDDEESLDYGDDDNKEGNVWDGAW